ncbi:MAG: chain length determinant protein tyrosine kinase EpsG [Pseudomonadota bacterium]
MNNLQASPNTAPRAELTLGRILLEQGKLNAQDAERVLRLQKEKNLRFGEAAVQLGLVTDADMRQALAQQFDYPYLAPGSGDLSPELVAAYEPFSHQMEALRGLRGQLMLRWFGRNKALAITSASATDGASRLTANLAVVFSQLGERTLLIDANLRTPQVSPLFKLENRMGLSDVLADRADVSAITRIPAFVDLSVLPAGTQAPNPAELLSREKLQDLLLVLAGEYDVILIDTPPATEAADFQAVAARARGALLVTRKHKTRLTDAAGIKAMLTAAGAETVGAVLNEV